MSLWRLIKTAPKDGTKIDLWVNNKRLTNVWWGKRSRSWLKGDSWCYECDDGWISNIGLSEPTHWMPIPEGPKND